MRLAVLPFSLWRSHKDDWLTELEECKLSFTKTADFHKTEFGSTICTVAWTERPCLICDLCADLTVVTEDPEDIILNKWLNSLEKILKLQLGPPSSKLC